MYRTVRMHDVQLFLLAAKSLMNELDSQIKDRIAVFGNADFDTNVLTPYRAR